MLAQETEVGAAVVEGLHGIEGSVSEAIITGERRQHVKLHEERTRTGCAGYLCFSNRNAMSQVYRAIRYSCWCYKGRKQPDTEIVGQKYQRVVVVAIEVLRTVILKIIY